MKTRYLFYLLLLLFIGCKENSKKEAAKVIQVASTTVIKDYKKDSEKDSNAIQIPVNVDCEAYWKSIYVSDSAKARYLAQVISLNTNSLSPENKNFLLQLHNELLHPEKFATVLAFNKILAPVFKLDYNQLGVFGFPKPDPGNKNIDADISPEKKLVKYTTYETTENHGNSSVEVGKLIHYPHVLDSIYTEEKPLLYVYTTKGRKRTRLKDFGLSIGDCLGYYHYSLEEKGTELADENLFTSTLALDLVYEKNPALDYLLKTRYLNQCADCPSSDHLEKSFAKLKGTENIYFIYADTFPLNNKLETPSRGLVLRAKENKLINLWHQEVDLVGCECI